MVLRYTKGQSVTHLSLLRKADDVQSVWLQMNTFAVKCQSTPQVSFPWCGHLQKYAVYKFV
jgi:hypothetical protein